MPIVGGFPVIAGLTEATTNASARSCFAIATNVRSIVETIKDVANLLKRRGLLGSLFPLNPLVYAWNYSVESDFYYSVGLLG